MKHARLALSLAVVLAAAAVAPRAEAQEKLLLKEKAKVGDTFTEISTFETVGKLRVKERGSEEEYRLLNRKEEVTGEQVQAVEEGLPTRLRRHYVTQRNTDLPPGRPGPEVKDGPLAGLVVVIDGLGARRKVVCVNGELSGDEAKEVEHSPISRILPAGPVAVGDAWEVPQDVLTDLFFSSGEDRSTRLAMLCRFAELADEGGKRCARIALDLALEAADKEGRVTTMATQGFLLFAIDEGFPLRLSMNGKMTVTATQGEGDAAVTFHAEGEVTTSVERTPGKADLGSNEPPKKKSPKARAEGDE